MAASFAAFRDELDDHNDARERVIKASREITALSKKAIFLLHRIALDGDPTPGARAQDKLRDIQRCFAALADDLRGPRFWRYRQNISGGLQEYIEALSFAHYLDHGTLITYDAVLKSLTSDEGVPYLPLPVDDFLLGLSDLTGELMRFAISAISRKGGRTKAADVCSFVRNCRSDFESFTPYVRDLRKKQQVTSSSLQKIEDAAYAIAVRTSEYDLPPEMLDDIVSRCISDVGGSAADRRPRHDDFAFDEEN